MAKNKKNKSTGADDNQNRNDINTGTNIETGGLSNDSGKKAKKKNTYN